MKAMQGGTAQNDTIAAHQIAVLLRGGLLPQAYVYPAEMRATRDLLRRRCHRVRKRAELVAHIHTTTSHYTLPELGQKLAYQANREGVAEHCPAPSVRKTIEVAVALINPYDHLLGAVALSMTPTAQAPDGQTFSRLPSVPGSGQMLALVIVSEMQDSARFPRVQDFVSYCRVVQCAKASGGNRRGTAGTKIGTVHLRWALAAAAVLCLRHHQPGKE